ncbi:MAG TPA: PQQ-dependent sugar dehydrogenase, partial [Kofleriaceae bacterium]|nr:PQQ-dependent sugar dehydrogenase [Kofleriaceae bacterium]
SCARDQDAPASAPAAPIALPETTPAAQPAGGTPRRANRTGGFEPVEVARFDEPWAMTFLPDGRLLVTEKRGAVKLMSRDGKVGRIAGAPRVDYGGQGGLGDILLHPSFGQNRLVYLSWAEAGKGGKRGAAVGRARLALDDRGGGRLEGMEVIWRQTPKVSGSGHYGHRLVFASDGHLFVTSGERQKFDPAQDMSANLGKIVRLKDDGSAAAGNPFASKGGVAAQIWSYGHRNPLGIAFDAQGQLWAHEMGPQGGDELNLIEKGSNYGYPLVSNGDHYSGAPIPDHKTRPDLNAPEVTWNPVISPAGFIIYSGDRFPAWRGDGFIGGLSSQALIRIEFDGKRAREAQRWDMGNRIREIEQGPDGGIWVLEDGGKARLLRLEPKP